MSVVGVNARIRYAATARSYLLLLPAAQLTVTVLALALPLPPHTAELRLLED